MINLYSDIKIGDTCGLYIELSYSKKNISDKIHRKNEYIIKSELESQSTFLQETFIRFLEVRGFDACRIYSHVYSSLYLLMKPCYSKFIAFGLSFGSFFKAHSMNYLSTFEPLLISSYSVTILIIYDFRVMLKGLSPWSN